MTAAKTVERLVMYGLLLEELQARNEVTHVFSGQIADMVGNTAAQVRRDLMAVGLTGSTRHGYPVADLLRAIRGLLEPPGGTALAVAGVGNLGRALLGYFSLLKPKFRVAAAFDTDDGKVNRIICGCRVNHVREMQAVLAGNPVQLGVITVPADQAQRVADAFVGAGVRGIVTFAPTPLRVPQGVWLENMHITAAFEKAAYFARRVQQG